MISYLIITIFIYQKCITIPCLSWPNKVDSNYEEKKSIELQGEMDKIPISLKDFNMFPQLLIKSSKYYISKDREELSFSCSKTIQWVSIEFTLKINNTYYSQYIWDSYKFYHLLRHNWVTANFRELLLYR